MTKERVFNSRGLSAILLGAAILFGVLLTTVAGSRAATAPAVAGDWQGTLDVGGGNTLRVVVHISDKDGKLSGAIDSPDQGASGIAITAITYKEPDLHFEVGSIEASYDGKMNKENSLLTGNWKQGGGSLPLNFKRMTK